MENKFDLRAGDEIAKKYKVIEKLGSGYEGEVYKVVETSTGIFCAAKLFFPKRNEKNRAAKSYALKLHSLRECDIILKYYTQEKLLLKDKKITVFIYEYIEGTILANYISSQPRKRLSIFKAVHLLYAILEGLELIHHYGFVHGDLHEENIIVRRVGLSYELKLLDFFNTSGTRKQKETQDMIDAIKIFYNSLGGSKTYKSHPRQIKEICCGLRRHLLESKFRSISELKLYLENQEW